MNDQREGNGETLLGPSDYAEVGRRVLRRFTRHDMAIYGAALAQRGLLALIPAALLVLVLIGLFGVETALPRVTEMLLRLRPGTAAAADVPPLGALLSISAVVGVWSAATGARMLMRALNAVHEAREQRPAARRTALSFVALPALALVAVLATVLLLVTSQMVAWLAGGIGLGGVVRFLGSWLRFPVALGLVGCAVAAVYRYGPSVRVPWRAVAAGAALAVALWAAASFAFGVAVSTVLDYGTTYGSFGGAVALLVYLHLSAAVLLLGAEVSAVIGRPGA